MKKITADIINSDGKRLKLHAQDGIEISSESNAVFRITGTYDEGDKPHFDIHTIRGTIDNPAVLRPGDYGTNMSFTTQFVKNGLDIGKSLVSLVPRIDPSADETDNAPASDLNILVNAGDGKGDLYNDYRIWKFNSGGAIESKIFQCGEQDTASINKIKLKNGMIIYNNDKNKFQGYADGKWVDLH